MSTGDDGLITTILTDFATLDAKFLLLLQREMSTFHFRDCADISYSIASIELNNGLFHFNLSSYSSATRNRSRDLRPNAIEQVLALILDRIRMYDVVHNIEYEPNVADRVQGGYDLYVE